MLAAVAGKTAAIDAVGTPERGSGIQRLPERTPALAKVLDDPLDLLVGDLDEFVGEVAVLPFDDHWSERPTKVLAQRLIGKPVPVELQTTYQSVRIIDRPVLADDCVVGDFVWHLEPFLLGVRDVGGTVRDPDMRRHLALEVLKFATFFRSDLRST
jgi:hypothetical protein